MTYPFEDEFMERTTKRRRDLRGRQFMQCVALSINCINSATYRLTYIETLSHLRGYGYASLALNWLCGLADKHEIQLELVPVPLDEDTPDLVRLTRWYQSFGFRRIGMNDEMIRQPKRSFVERKTYAAAG